VKRVATLLCVFAVFGICANCLAYVIIEGSPPDKTAGNVAIKAQVGFADPAQSKPPERPKEIGPLSLWVLYARDGETAAVALTDQVGRRDDSLWAMSSIGIGVRRGDLKRSVKPFVSISVRPTILSDGRISISGTVGYDKNGFSIRDARISATLEPGKAQELPTITVPSKTGRGEGWLDVTLTATVAEASQPEKGK